MLHVQAAIHNYLLSSEQSPPADDKFDIEVKEQREKLDIPEEDLPSYHKLMKFLQKQQNKCSCSRDLAIPRRLQAARFLVLLSGGH
ncbi:hypothetical protein PR048_033359 [Dryococelus australis]|uniref:Uncharacterized protein n=1 Tax=Dryococelus australis TaxID=614101 RepID=A0ABQ9G030_9NEOP|nr:hypothetical protein PR048_033359 [Dryococelus australis]